MQLESSSFLGRKVGLLGGTFDPVHNGHLFIAGAVHQRLQLDAVLFVPAASPPHKVDYAISSFADRCRMLEIALADNPGLHFTTLEQQRSGPSFTIDTLISLHECFPERQFYFIIGSDAFADIGSWKRYLELLNYCHFVVIRRGGAASPDPAATVARVYPDWVFSGELGGWRAPRGKGDILVMDLPPVAISSTMIRARALNNLSLEGMIPAQVAHYIDQAQLYRTPGPAGHDQ